MSAISTKYDYLIPNPNSAYKQLFIKGTRIRAEVIYSLCSNDEAMSAEEIAVDYGLPLAAVKEAIAYCESDPPELASDHTAEESLMEASGMNEPGYKYHPTPKLLSAQEMAQLWRL